MLLNKSQTLKFTPVPQGLFKKNFCSNFPFKFGNKKNICEKDIHGIIEKQILDGFKYSYKNFIEAIYDKDEEYVRNVSEKTFADNLIGSWSENRVYLNEIPESAKEIKIEKAYFELAYGIKSNREENKSKALKKAKDIEVPFSYLKPKISMYMGPYSGFVVLRVIVDFKTNLLLREEITRDTDIREVHSLIFESETKNPKILFSLLDESKTPTFIKLLFKREKQIDFKIVDLDNFMEGNPLV